MRCYPNILLKNTRGAASNFCCKYFLSLLSEVVFEGKKFHFSIEGENVQENSTFFHTIQSSGA